MTAASNSTAPASSHADAVPGLAARRLAADILDAVLRRRRPLDDELDSAATRAALAGLPERDRALTRALVATVLRRLCSLRHLLGLFLDHGAPKEAPRVETALLLGAAQILLLDVPDHAAVDLAVRLTQADRHAARYAGLVNAVLRRLAREGAERLAGLGAAVLDTPEWLMARWIATYGEATARAIAAANNREPALDLTIKSDPGLWAARLGGRVLPTGTVRMIAHGAITALPGFAEGAWWVQDAAAALPVRLLGDVSGLRVADLCAAPGGKTAQLAAQGGRVFAVDRSNERLKRVKENLARLGLEAECVAADASIWKPASPLRFVLLDAPCTATGAIRRNPDVPHLKAPDDVKRMAELQDRLLAHAVSILAPGGVLVYCTCSLEDEEGPARIEKLLAGGAPVSRRPIAAFEIGGWSQCLSPAGDLRTLPCQLADAGGLDGFYAARLARNP